MSVKLTDGRFIKSYLYMILGPMGLMLCLFRSCVRKLPHHSVAAREGPMPIIFKAIDLVSLPHLKSIDSLYLCSDARSLSLLQRAG
ncbi:MAG: hypothetical protein R3C24_09130 [Cyanobacteriota/Melainabacteria group bacterium]